MAADRSGITGQEQRYHVDDPLQRAFEDLPYVALPDVRPSFRSAELKRARLELQRQGKLDARARLAFRALSSLPERLAWDALCSAVVALEDAELHRAVTDALAAGERGAAYEALTKAALQDAATAPLHLLVVLLVHDLSEHARTAQPAPDRLRSLFLGMVPALLARKTWLREFARSRCDALRVRNLLNREVEKQFSAKLQDQLENVAVRCCQGGDGTPSPQQILECERVAIEIGGHVSAGYGLRVPVHRFGPLGLAGTDLVPEAQEWLLTEQRNYSGGLPLTQLRQRIERRETKRDPAADLALLQWTFSSLGPVVAQLWCHRPKEAGRLLAERSHTAEQDRDPWFGAGRGSVIRLARAIEELRAEVLLDILRLQLGDPGEEADEVCFTVEHLLCLSDGLRNAAPALLELENALCGRLRALANAANHADMERILRVLFACRESLVARRRSDSCFLAAANALKTRAARLWNGSTTPAAQRQAAPAALRDMFRAVELAPQSPEIATNLGRLALQVQRYKTSEVERSDLLRKAMQVIDACLASTVPGAATVELRKAKEDLLTEMDPDEAMSRRLERLRRVVQIAVPDDEDGPAQAMSEQQGSNSE